LGKEEQSITLKKEQNGVLCIHRTAKPAYGKTIGNATQIMLAGPSQKFAEGRDTEFKQRRGKKWGAIATRKKLRSRMLDGGMIETVNEMPRDLT